MNMANRPGFHFLIAAAALGVIQLIVAIMAPFHSIVISLIFDLCLLSTAYVAGQHAHRVHGHPGWFGAAVGAIYGFLAGLSYFILTITSTDLRTRMNLSKIPVHEIHDLLTLYNSTAYHLAEWLMAVLFYGIMTLIIGSIGGVLAKKASERNAI
jgi:hypothetical protein